MGCKFLSTTVVVFPLYLATFALACCSLFASVTGDVQEETTLLAAEACSAGIRPEVKKGRKVLDVAHHLYAVAFARLYTGACNRWFAERGMHHNTNLVQRRIRDRLQTRCGALKSCVVFFIAKIPSFHRPKVVFSGSGLYAMQQLHFHALVRIHLRYSSRYRTAATYPTDDGDRNSANPALLRFRRPFLSPLRRAYCTTVLPHCTRYPSGTEIGWAELAQLCRYSVDCRRGSREARGSLRRRHQAYER